MTGPQTGAGKGAGHLGTGRGSGQEQAWGQGGRSEQGYWSVGREWMRQRAGQGTEPGTRAGMERQGVQHSTWGLLVELTVQVPGPYRIVVLGGNV